MKRSGFTLIELILSVAVLGTMTALSVPALLKYIEDSATKHGAISACKETMAFLTENPPYSLDGVEMTIDGERFVEHGNETVTVVNLEPLAIPGKVVLKNGDHCRIYTDSGIEVIGEESGVTLLRVLDAAATRTHLLTGMKQACPPGILYYMNNDQVSFMIRRNHERLDELRSLPCDKSAAVRISPPKPADIELNRTKRLLKEYESRQR